MRFAVDAVFVISLARRPDRLEVFWRGVPDDWPLPRPDVFPAIDGSVEPPPGWWRSARGAWGCYRSHLAVIERCLADGIESVLILEDDATFSDDFTARVNDLRVPEDCQQLYLGGQHLARPSPGPGGLLAGRNINRTHAYAILCAGALELFKHHLRPDPRAWVSKHHVDHHYGILHRRQVIRAYAVDPWLVGQAAGQSDVGKSSESDRWWRQ